MIRRSVARLFVLMLCVVALPVIGPAEAAWSAPNYADWPTYHGDDLRTGVAATVDPVRRTPTQLWSVHLDGAVYASPIVVDHGIAIVATENNTLYRIARNRVIWSRHIGAPVPLSALPCGDINPLGITGTPAYDPVTNTVIAVAELGGPIRHVAVGIDPVSGAVRWTRNVDVPASVPGVAARAMQQRGGLLVLNRRVYVAYGGLAGDCSAYRGSVIGLDLDHPTTAALWRVTVPTSREGGIWSPPGPVEDPGGVGILVSVGNGASTQTGPYDYTDSVLRLRLQRIFDNFSPASWRSDNANDLDLGSQNPTIVGTAVFMAGKSGTAYLLDRSHLGGIGAQLHSMNLCRSFGGTAMTGRTVIVPCTDGLRAVRVNLDNTMTLGWHADTDVTGSPVVGGGRVWALDTAHGRLDMLEQSTGRTLASFVTGAVNRFATPALYGHAVIVGTLTGVKAFSWGP